jgi:diacylglycerol kinase (ATP)
MHKVRLFLNDRASSGAKVGPQIELVQKKLFRSQIDHVRPTSLAELKTELQKAVQDRVDVVVSVGGDGTVNTLIQHLGATDTAFLVIPAGTANDLAREMGLLHRIDRAIDLIRDGKPEEIDLIKVNDNFMATNGGLGIASKVAERVNTLRARVPLFKSTMSLFKDRVYTATLGAELVLGPMHFNELEVESEEFQGRIRTPLIMFNNQAALGGKFRIAPETTNNDGHFNVSAFLHPRRRDFLKSVLHIRYRGRPVSEDPDFLSFETKKIKVRSFHPILFYGDGETFEKNSEYTIEILPKALKVFGFRRIQETQEKKVPL